MLNYLKNFDDFYFISIRPFFLIFEDKKSFFLIYLKVNKNTTIKQKFHI